MSRQKAPGSSSKKPAQVQFQTELNSDQDFDEFVKKPGLLVIDVYTEWCGPCIAMVTTLKKLKVEVGGENLLFAIANSDKISYLKLYRNRSEPTWIFIEGSMVVKIMFGAGAPTLARKVVAELEKEKAVREGKIRRTGIIPISELATYQQEHLMVREAETETITDELTEECTEIDWPLVRVDYSAIVAEDKCTSPLPHDEQ